MIWRMVKHITNGIERRAWNERKRDGDGNSNRCNYPGCITLHKYDDREKTRGRDIMNVKKRINLFFAELTEAMEMGMDAIEDNDCDNEGIFIEVTVAYKTSELRRKKDKIDMWIEKEEFEENAEKISETLRAVDKAVGVDTAEEEI